MNYNWLILYTDLSSLSTSTELSKSNVFAVFYSTKGVALGIVHCDHLVYPTVLTVLYSKCQSFFFMMPKQKVSRKSRHASQKVLKFKAFLNCNTFYK